MAHDKSAFVESISLFSQLRIKSGCPSPNASSPGKNISALKRTHCDIGRCSRSRFGFRDKCCPFSADGRRKNLASRLARAAWPHRSTGEQFGSDVCEFKGHSKCSLSWSETRPLILWCLVLAASSSPSGFEFWKRLYPVKN